MEDWLGIDFVGVITLGPYSVPKGRLKIIIFVFLCKPTLYFKHSKVPSITIFQTLLVISKGSKDAFLVKYPINYKNKSSSQNRKYTNDPHSTPQKMVPRLAFLQCASFCHFKN